MDWELAEKISSTLLTPVIIIIGSYIAYRQYKISSSKHSIELFNEREKIFNLINKIFIEIIAKDSVSFQSLNDYYELEREVKKKIPFIEDRYYRIRKIIEEINEKEYDIEINKEIYLLDEEEEDSQREEMIEQKRLKGNVIKLHRKLKSEILSFQKSYSEAVTQS